MQLRGKALLEHALAPLRASNLEDIVVILGAHEEEIRKEIRFARERVVFNPEFVDGMSTSIRAGLRAMENAEAALIVLADQPFVSPRTIDLLIEEHRRTHASAIIPTYEGKRGNPVLVDRALFPEMLKLRGDVGFRAILNDHADSIVFLAVDDRGVVTDIDTPEDISRYG